MPSPRYLSRKMSYSILAVVALTAISMGGYVFINDRSSTVFKYKGTVLGAASIQPVITIADFGARGQAPFTAVFTAVNSTDSAGTITRYEWDFGDDNSANGYPRYSHDKMAAHRYENQGTYTVTLTVYDDQGNSNSSTVLNYNSISWNGAIVATPTTAAAMTVVSPPATTAKTYYVAANGNDTWTGLCSTAPTSGTCGPWKTINHVVSMYDSINGGDTILFNRGDTFDTYNSLSTITFPSVWDDTTKTFSAVSGSWGLSYRNAVDGYQSHTILKSPPYFVTLGAYGSGAKPIITSVTSRAESTSTATFMMLDGGSQFNNRGIVIDGLDIRGTMWISSNPNGAGNGDDPGMMTVIRNSRLGLNTGGAGHYIQWGGSAVIENSEFDGTGLSSNIVLFGTANNPNFVYVGNSSIHNSSNHCVYLSGASTHVLFYNNDVYNCGSTARPFDAFSAHGYQEDINNIGNKIHDSYFAFGYEANGQNPGEFLTDIVIDRNTIYNMTSHTFQLGGNHNMQISNNLIYNITAQDQPIFWFRYDYAAAADTSNVRIFNNTIYTGASGLLFVDTGGANGVTANGTKDIHIFNNIIVNGASTSPFIKDNRIYPLSAIASYLDFNNNLYNNVPSTGTQVSIGGTTNYTMAQWLSTYEPQSKTGDPQVVNAAANDYRLTSSSVAIGAGAPKWIPYDFALTARSTTNPSIGAYENIAATVTPPPATNTNTTPTNSNTMPAPTSNTNTTSNTTCVPSWSCSGWTACDSSGYQTQSCSDSRHCGTTLNMPSLMQKCTYTAPTNTGGNTTSNATCVPSWSCSAWSACSASGVQTRSCVDNSHCNATSGAPATTQVCINSNTNKSVPAPAITLTVGSLVKIATSANVYLISSINPPQKRLIPSEGVFIANGYSWIDIRIVSPAELNLYATSTPITYPNNVLLTSSTATAVYRYTNGKRQLFLNSKYFLANGYHWSDIKVISAKNLLAIPLGSNVKYPNGVLLKSGSSLYWLDSGSRRLITSTAVFNSIFNQLVINNLSGFGSLNVITISSSELNMYPSGSKIRSAADVSAAKVQALDSDQDGLYDYMEYIIGTDPHDSDTDHDGYPDGVEVLTGHDPLHPPQ